METLTTSELAALLTCIAFAAVSTVFILVTSIAGLRALPPPGRHNCRCSCSPR
jgi:hypothetical protein